MSSADADLRETVARMEEHLRTHPLFPVYEGLIGRFTADFQDERDVLLSRAAVLGSCRKPPATLLDRPSRGRETESEPVTNS